MEGRRAGTKRLLRSWHSPCWEFMFQPGVAEPPALHMVQIHPGVTKECVCAHSSPGLGKTCIPRLALLPRPAGAARGAAEKGGCAQNFSGLCRREGVLKISLVYTGREGVLIISLGCTGREGVLKMSLGCTEGKVCSAPLVCTEEKVCS